MYHLHSNLFFHPALRQHEPTFFFFFFRFFISNHWLCGVVSSSLLVANLLFVFELLIKIKSFAANKWAVFLQFVTKTYLFFYRMAMVFRENLPAFIRFWPKSDSHFRKGPVTESAQSQTDRTMWRGMYTIHSNKYIYKGMKVSQWCDKSMVFVRHNYQNGVLKMIFGIEQYVFSHTFFEFIREVFEQAT